MGSQCMTWTEKHWTTFSGTSGMPKILVDSRWQDWTALVTANNIRDWTRRDQELSRVLQYVHQGWPSEGDPDLEPYSSRRLELSSFEGCVLWGSRVVIPPPGRQAVLMELHEGHPGITRMKFLARMYV